MNNKFYIKLKTETVYHVLDEQDKYSIVDKLPRSSFEVLGKQYTPDEAGLKAYKDDFIQWCKELRYNKHRTIIYTKYTGNYGATLATFKRLCKGLYEHHKPITVKESEYFSMCHNGPSTYCKKGTHQCYGYDFSSFYGSLLASDELILPTEEGQEMTLKKLPISKKLKVGFYRVKITSTSQAFRDIFTFSRDSTYTNYSLAFALRKAKKYGVTIELIQDGKPNAFIYDKVEPSSKIFKNWFDTLNAIKKDHPKNKLIKHLISSVWGTMTKANTEKFTLEEIEEKIIKQGLTWGATSKNDYMIRNINVNDTNTYFELLNTKQPYKHNLRIKPFLSSLARVTIEEIALKNYDHVIRIQTDSIVFDQPFEHNIEGLIPEEKTTGLIKWYHVNKKECL